MITLLILLLILITLMVSVYQLFFFDPKSDLSKYTTKKS